jgi:MFS family permease
MVKSFGWIQSFRFTDYLTVIAAVIGIMNLSVGVQTLSRVIFGIVVGINTIIIPTYLTSVLPGAMGGPAGTLNQLFIVIGIFFGFWMGFIVVGQDILVANWRFIIALPIIPALIRLHTAQNVYPYIIINEDMKQLKA